MGLYNWMTIVFVLVLIGMGIPLWRARKQDVFTYNLALAFLTGGVGGGLFGYMVSILMIWIMEGGYPPIYILPLLIGAYIFAFYGHKLKRSEPVEPKIHST